MKNNVKKLVTMSILVAMSLVLLLLIRFPIIPAAPYLEYEPADVPILIGGFIYGPAAGIIITLVASLIQSMTVSAGSGWIGCLMHIFATGALVGVSALIYKRNRTLKGAIIGLICGSISMALIMIPTNLVFTPILYGMPVEAVIDTIVPVIIPFNILKAGINSVLVLIVYKSVGKLLVHISR